jgi:hypothetical protein
MSHREQLLATLTVTLISLCLAIPASATGFRAAGHFNAGSHPIAVAAGDFDGDGNLDLAVVNSNRTVSVLAGLGDGTFRDRVDYAIGVNGRSIVVADINGDGNADLAIGDAGTKSLSILQGRGDGTFQAHTESSSVRASAALVTLLSNQKTYRTGTQSVAVVFGDFNRDGLQDQAVTSTRYDNVSVLLGTRDMDHAAPPATNLIVNPGFETGALSPWVQGRDFCSSPCRNWAATRSMPKAGKFDGGNEGNIEVVQNFTATSTSGLTKAAFYARHPAGSEPSAADFFYSDGTDDEFVGFTTDTSWDALDFTADLAAGKMLNGFSTWGFSASSGVQTTFIDNVLIH